MKIKEPFEFQVPPINFVVENAKQGRNSYLACAAGLGKTGMAVCAAKELKKNDIVVACPKILIPTWKKAFAGEWGYVPKNVTVGTYPAIKKHLENGLPVDFLIPDEAHYLQNEKTARTKNFFAYKNKWKGAVTVYLSATPFEKPVQMYPIISREVRPKIGWVSYIRRYCEGYKDHFGWYTDGSSNLPHLKNAIKQFMFILDESACPLPPVSMEVVPLPVTRTQKQLDKHVISSLGDVNIDDFINAPTAFITPDSMASYRYETGMQKVDAAIEFLKASEAEKEPVVLFAYHRDVIQKLGETLNSCVTVYGGNTFEQNVKNIEVFSEGQKQYIVLSLASAIEGLTLTNSTRAVFVELPMTGKTFYQAYKRIHRISQEFPVNVQLLAQDESVDYRVGEILTERYSVLEDFGVVTGTKAAP